MNCPKYVEKGHNPYFSRWFSAIGTEVIDNVFNCVTILILVDGFLQWRELKWNTQNM